MGHVYVQINSMCTGAEEASRRPQAGAPLNMRASAHCDVWDCSAAFRRLQGATGGCPHSYWRCSFSLKCMRTSRDA